MGATPLPRHRDPPYPNGSEQDHCPRGTPGPVETLQGLSPASLLFPEALPGIVGGGSQLCLFLPHAASLRWCLHTSQQGCGPTAAPHEPSRCSSMVTREWDNGTDHHLKNSFCKPCGLQASLTAASPPPPAPTASGHSHMDGLREIALAAPLLSCFCLARLGFIQEGQQMAFRYADELAGGEDM